MLDLFRVEAESQTHSLSAGLLELERNPASAQTLQNLMRAAHSLKGAARIVNLPAVARIAHALEDCFAAAQARRLWLRRSHIDILFRGVDLLTELHSGTQLELERWGDTRSADIHSFLEDLSRSLSPEAGPRSPRDSVQDGPQADGSAAAPQVRPEEVPELAAAPAASPPQAPERVLRLAADNLNRLLGLAGESLGESRWLRPFNDALQRLRRRQMEIEDNFERLRSSFEGENVPAEAQSRLLDLTAQIKESRRFLAEHVEELDRFDRRSAHLSHRLYLEVLRARMCLFADGVRAFPRMVRDLARSLDKTVRLEIAGESTAVDRDILDRLEAPLAHLLRNAVDHGCEKPAERLAAGKPPEATIRLEARHGAGMLLVSVADDGAGIPLERLRASILEKGLAEPSAVGRLSEPELLNFLFAPGFTLKDNVTEVSGRGVGLDVVQSMVKAVRGSIRVTNEPGRGMRFQLQLPLTLSVVRALLVDVGGEPYAFPLGRISHTLKLSTADIEVLEGRPHFHYEGRQVSLLPAHLVLGCSSPGTRPAELSVVILGEQDSRCGLVVDRFLGERELVVHPLDPRLGKVRNISAATVMEDGEPALIVDTDDLLATIDRMAAEGLPPGAGLDLSQGVPRKAHRILAVDDSLTVRELQRKLLTSHGYLADVAVDGVDAWNALHTAHYDLVITDVDMPKMDGIELATLIKQDARLKSLPVLIVSYKDSDEDRMRGLEAGADYYLTKGAFQEEALLQAIADLIGGPDE